MIEEQKFLQTTQGKEEKLFCVLWNLRKAFSLSWHYVFELVVWIFVFDLRHFQCMTIMKASLLLDPADKFNVKIRVGFCLAGV